MWDVAGLAIGRPGLTCCGHCETIPTQGSLAGFDSPDRDGFVTGVESSAISRGLARKTRVLVLLNVASFVQHELFLCIDLSDNNVEPIIRERHWRREPLYCCLMTYLASRLPLFFFLRMACLACQARWARSAAYSSMANSMAPIESTDMDRRYAIDRPCVLTSSSSI